MIPDAFGLRVKSTGPVGLDTVAVRRGREQAPFEYLVSTIHGP